MTTKINNNKKIQPSKSGSRIAQRAQLTRGVGGDGCAVVVDQSCRTPQHVTTVVADVAQTIPQHIDEIEHRIDVVVDSRIVVEGRVRLVRRVGVRGCVVRHDHRLLHRRW